LALAFVAAYAARVVAFLAGAFEAAVRALIVLRCRRGWRRSARRLLTVVATATVAALTIIVAPFAAIAALSAIATIIVAAASVISVAPFMATAIVALRRGGRSH
jgi:hypothetical protein